MISLRKVYFNSQEKNKLPNQPRIWDSVSFWCQKKGFSNLKVLGVRVLVCGLNIHERCLSLKVCVCALHESICHLTVFVKNWGIKQQCLPAPAFTRTRPDDIFFLLHVCVCLKKKHTHTHKELRRGTEAGGCNGKKCIHTRVLGTICFGCMLIWMPVLCCGLRRVIVVTLPILQPRRGAGFIWRMLCFCVTRQSEHPDRHWQTVSMVTRAHPSWLHQPYLLGCHGTLQRLGLRRASSACLFFIAWRARRRGQERKWRPFLHVGRGLLSAIFLSLAQQWKCSRMHFLYPGRRLQLLIVDVQLCKNNLEDKPPFVIILLSHYSLQIACLRLCNMIAYLMGSIHNIINASNESCYC